MSRTIHKQSYFFFQAFRWYFHRYFPSEFSRKSLLFLTSEAIENNYRNNLYDNIKDKNISRKLKLRLKNTIIDKTLTYVSETWILTKRERERERKQLNVFERKVYRRVLGPVYDNEKENWRILTNKKFMQVLKNPP